MSETPTVNPEGSDKQKSGSFTESRMESAIQSPRFQSASAGWQQPSGALFSSGEVSDKKLKRAKTVIKANSYFCWFYVAIITFGVATIFASLDITGTMIAVAIIAGCGLTAYGLLKRNGFAATIWILITLMVLFGFLTGSINPQIPENTASTAYRFGVKLSWYIFASQAILGAGYVWAFFVLRSHDKAQNNPNGSETETATS
ncbi:MAG: hypothetical protein JKY49_14035 [Cohaesibacteraceae bacterium]|nr:hypothetical protein [Cohaesibacteraceae bacterium]MBL4876800.1 hypothetical protein [Cohaesibacteraceae bacterium]